MIKDLRLPHVGTICDRLAPVAPWHVEIEQLEDEGETVTVYGIPRKSQLSDREARSRIIRASAFPIWRNQDASTACVPTLRMLHSGIRSVSHPPSFRRR